MAETVEAPNGGLSIAEVIQLMSQMNAQNQNSLIEAVKELKKPNEFEQIEIDKKLAQQKKKAEDHVAFGRIEEERKVMKVRSCSHSRHNPANNTDFHLWRGQVHDGDQGKPYFIPTCLDCNTQLPKIFCTQEQIREGVGLNKYRVDIEILLNWAESTGNSEVQAFRKRYKMLREAA